MPSPNNREKRIKSIIKAWSDLRPKKTFARMTLAQFEEAVEPSLSSRATVNECENKLVSALNVRDDADRKSLELADLVVKSVMGDPEEGANGDLYEAMGYVRKSERSSGLTRRRRSSGSGPAPAAAAA